MNAIEKKVFIEQLCEGIKRDLIDQIGRMPEHWTGVHLRRLIADSYRERSLIFDLKGAALEEYRDEVICNNLG